MDFTGFYHLFMKALLKLLFEFCSKNILKNLQNSKLNLEKNSEKLIKAALNLVELLGHFLNKIKMITMFQQLTLSHITIFQKNLVQKKGLQKLLMLIKLMELR